MISLLLKLFGAQVEDASRVSDLGLKFAGAYNAWLVILGAIVCGGLTWWIYRKPEVGISRFRRGALVGLRALFLEIGRAHV
jgi:hypothetical protein